MSKKVAIIGAGPGGLTAGMILANNGYDVQIFERRDIVGGRNGHIKLGDFTFDIGPTFLMMKFILDEVFELAGRKMDDYLDNRQIDPMYRLRFADGREFFPSSVDHESTEQQIAAMFPGNEGEYQRYLTREAEKFDRLVPCLQVPYEKRIDMLSKRLLHALPLLDFHLSLFSHLGHYFNNDDLKISFTFQAKYLGMSPWTCPATFSIISYIEHESGIWHPIGGLHQISEAMAKVVREHGGKIHLNSPVKRIMIDDGTATGIELDTGEKIDADYVFLNADFAHAMHNLVSEKDHGKWNKRKLKNASYSCSTFMLYLGVDKVYDKQPHHNILFSQDYEQNVREIAETRELSEDPSIYVQNASVTDPTLAPEGQSAIYVLVPITNNKAGIDWEAEKQRYRDKVIKLIETRGGFTDLSKHIVAEKIITPHDWENEYNVHYGATFNLGHNVSQMLIWRPHNRFEDIKNVYLVGGGTHPGSGLPTIYESGRISANYLLGK